MAAKRMSTSSSPSAGREVGELSLLSVSQRGELQAHKDRWPDRPP